MRKHGGTPSQRDKHVTPAAISPPSVARGRFVGGQQSGIAGCKPPPLFKRGASSCSSQRQRQREPWGASPLPRAPTYLQSKMQPLQDMQIRADPKKILHDGRGFVGACNFYRRHIHNFTYCSAPLTDLIKKTTPWRWTAREEECFQELKKKFASSNCLGVSCPKGEIVLITDASDVGGDGTIYQWQELNPAELTHCHYRTI